MINKWLFNIKGKKMKLKNVAILLIAPMVLAGETSKELENMYSSCLNKYPSINNGIVGTCAENISDKSNKHINRLYNIIYKGLKKVSSEDASNFVSSQKSWIIYRDKHCNLVGSYVGSPYYYVCPMNERINRVKELEELSEYFIAIEKYGN